MCFLEKYLKLCIKYLSITDYISQIKRKTSISYMTLESNKMSILPTTTRDRKKYLYRITYQAQYLKNSSKVNFFLLNS